MELANPWELIDTPKNLGAFNSKRVGEQSKHDFWWTLDCKGNPGLAIEFKSVIELPHSLPHQWN